MVAVWWGTQADEAFPEAWHSDTGGHAHFRSKVYLSPKLWYLRVNVIEAQDLNTRDKARLPEPVYMPLVFQLFLFLYGFLACNTENLVTSLVCFVCAVCEGSCWPISSCEVKNCNCEECQPFLE
jgi:hypothetical protein